MAKFVEFSIEGNSSARVSVNPEAVAHVTEMDERGLTRISFVGGASDCWVSATYADVVKALKGVRHDG